MVTLEWLGSVFEIYTLFYRVYGEMSMILCNSWGHLGGNVEAMSIKIADDHGRKVKNGPPKWQIDVEWHMECISYHPKRIQKQNINTFPLNLKGGEAPQNVLTKRAGPSGRG